MLLLVGAVLVGARLVSAADRTVEVWQLNRAVPSGARLDAADLDAVRVHFDEGAAQGRYLLATSGLPAEAELTRAVGAGELLPADAVQAGSRDGFLELPLVVGAAGFPTNLRTDDLVDVWAVSNQADGADPTGSAERLLTEVPVEALSSADFATATSDRSVVVGLADPGKVARILDALVGRSVVLVRVGG